MGMRDWCAIAAGTMPDATVDSVIGAIYDNCDPDVVVKEVDEQLKKTASCKDILEMRQYYDGVYNGFGMPYPFSYANEVVTKGVTIFRMVNGNTKEAILAGVNMGRDTDCVAAVAGGIAGALSGSSSLPLKWIEQLDYATSINPHTNSRRTLRENADGVYNAFLYRMEKEKAYIDRMLNY